MRPRKKWRFRSSCSAIAKAIPKASPGFKAQQNTNWAWYEVRVRCEEAPGVIALGFTFDGVGTAWMEDVELLHAPATAGGK